MARTTIVHMYLPSASSGAVLSEMLADEDVTMVASVAQSDALKKAAEIGRFVAARKAAGDSAKLSDTSQAVAAMKWAWTVADDCATNCSSVRVSSVLLSLNEC